MMFFRLSGLLTDEKWTEENNDWRVMKERARRISLKTESFNRKLHGRASYYVADLAEGNLLAGVFCRDKAPSPARTKAYFEALGLAPTQTSLEEITFDSAKSLLRRANRDDFINDDDEFLEQFGLDKLDNNRRLDYSEELIGAETKSAVYQRAEGLPVRETLLPELDRIYAGRGGKKAPGHPVHYMLQSDEQDIRDEMVSLLLKALLANGRLGSRRCSTVEFRPGEGFSQTLYDCLYQCSAGGALIVKYLADEDTESDHASAGREIIERLCETMRKYQNEVLTVFCLPRECTRAKAIFYENLGSASIVELKEDKLSRERAERYLESRAKRRHIQCDKRLFEKLEQAHVYLTTELNAQFDEWYCRKLKTEIYPQYGQIAAARQEAALQPQKGSAYEELMEMIGLQEAKKVIRQALDMHKAQKLFSDKGMRVERSAMHMVFTGNPGTAKTSVARLFAGIMKENELLSRGTLVEVGRADLVGKYVGWTAPTIKKKFQDAMGGVLFIDEAYSLVDDLSGSYGDEAINTIVQEMENHRKDLIVIFAGYPDKMEQFLQKNPGLRSRIAFHVPFADYSTEELRRIAALTAKRSGKILSPEAEEKLGVLFDAARKGPDFGNGRYVRTVIEKACMAQASRLLGMDYDAVRKSDLELLRAEDIEMPPAKKDERRRIGF